MLWYSGGSQESNTQITWLMVQYLEAYDTIALVMDISQPQGITPSCDLT